MLKISNIKIPYEKKQDSYIKYIAKALRIKTGDISECTLERRSLDARKPKNIVYVCTFTAKIKNEKQLINKFDNVNNYVDNKYSFPYANLTADDAPIIVGTGPAGLFCALELARAGLRPVVIERGECVDERKNTIDEFHKSGKLNTNSNIQFGEGGAGTFSDGKLTCGLNDIRMDYIKEEFVHHGAPEDIAINAKPHIGTDYLAIAVKNIRREIISLGGKVMFNTLMTDIQTDNGSVCGIKTKNLKTNVEEYLPCSILVCAIGHSARDTYEMMYKKGFSMERKPFSVGIRIEHKREYINKLQYKDAFEDTSLPAADYKLASHPDGRGAYTFCMCPGGVVVASASEENSVVTNGMSYFARNAENSNSAVLVSVTPDDIPGQDVLGGMHFQRKLENAAYIAGGENYFAPCQTLEDFMAGRASTSAGSVNPSYRPGVRYTDIGKILPEFVTCTLRKAFLDFDKKMKGFAKTDALLTGLETRSSAPLRILRDESCRSNINGVYPIGEGAGYAGGIMSSALDGIKCAECICKAIADFDKQ